MARERNAGLTEKQCSYLARLVEREIQNFPPDFVSMTAEEESERVAELHELYAALRPGWHHVNVGASQYWTADFRPWYRRLADWASSWFGLRA